MHKLIEICPESLQATLSRALQAHTGHTKMSVDELAEKIGMKRRTMYRHRAGDAERPPSWFHIMAMVAILPPSFLNMLTEPLGIGGAHRLDEPASAVDLLVATSEWQQAFSENISDGEHCYRDWLSEQPLARKIQIAAGARQRPPMGVQRLVL